MQEFNRYILQKLISEGYRSIIYISKGDHGLIQPSKLKVPDELLTMIGGYQIDITEMEVIEMANGVEEFRFFVIEGLSNNVLNDN